MNRNKVETNEGVNAHFQSCNVGANLCVRPTLIKEPTFNCLLRTMGRHTQVSPCISSKNLQNKIWEKKKLLN